MTSEEAKTVFSALQGDVREPTVLFVGGCVRNAVIGRPVEDIDLTTVLKPEEVTQILEAKDIYVIPTGISHGTVTAVMNGRTFEITTLRHDVETDGRRAVVAYTDSWVEDAKRRDFTMNTLLMDLQGNVYDPLGQGIADLEAGVIRFAGEARQRIEEDYLRILRFFRFHALYGKGDYDAEALKACEAAADKIRTLSRERVTQEFFKIVASEKPYEILSVMFGHGILKDFAFSAEQGEFFKHFVTFQAKYNLAALSSRLFVFAGLDFAKIKSMEDMILFPKVFLKDMQAIDGALKLPDLSCDSAVRSCVYRFGRGITAQVLMIELVQDRVMNGYASAALKIVQKWDIPDFPISGNDLIASGMKEGAELGKKLRALENWWIEQDFQPDKEACLKRL